MLSKGERIGMQNNNNSSDNKRSKIILREDVLYTWITLIRVNSPDRGCSPDFFTHISNNITM